MENKPTSAEGIPTAGAFDASARKDANGRSFGQHLDGQWRVPETINLAVQDGETAFRHFRDVPESYDAMIRRSASADPDREAVICGDRRVSWATFDSMIQCTAHGLITAGLQPSERVAVMLDNRLEYLVAMLGTIRAGGIAIPLGTRLGPSDVAHILKDATPKFAVTATEWRAKFPDDGCPTRIFLTDIDPSADEHFGALQLAPACRLPELCHTDVAMIVYTSGTTGKPKGACLTHRNFVHTCLHYLYALAIDRPLKSLLAVPATHIAGFGPLASVTMASGGTIVMSKSFSPREAVELIDREKISYAVLVPAMYQLLVMKAPLESYDLSSWVYGVFGGAIMPPATIKRFSKVAPELRMINAYGATETCAVCTIMPPELTQFAPESVGLALECDDIKIMGEDGRPVGDGESGELWIRGPNVSPGYWNNPEATAREFVDGYWRSGDVGHRDKNGLIYVSDRLKDMINRGGFKVFSAEVENSLMSHPKVEDCAVVGVPDPVLGEKTFAQIKTSEVDLSGDELRNYLRERIADYKVPDFWKLGDEPIPRNQNGKVQKAIIRETAKAYIAQPADRA
ncbi:class I adenylate-forming enzyme family protein [Solirhodobacter olei]|uniref:class I adenylate-forming enzyme family protein n=1 Tax=Solirhodobacter olei TaxID=2493082 RepID=UPI000FDB42C5|nr:class I adenylate-forming enzyme family protein [Solirhodobacter olei]